MQFALQFHGNQDDTKLYYLGEKPRGAPDVLAAGQSVLVTNVTSSFEVLGDHELGVVLFLQGGELEQKGETDPSQSIAIATEQFRRRYAFLAPSDFTVSYADVIAPSGAELKLDGAVVKVPREPFSCSSFEVARIWLDSSGGGVHVLEASQPVGVQVVGHALYTSYQYPGGLNVAEIAPPAKRPVVK